MFDTDKDVSCVRVGPGGAVKEGTVKFVGGWECIVSDEWGRFRLVGTFLVGGGKKMDVASCKFEELNEEFTVGLVCVNDGELG